MKKQYIIPEMHLLLFTPTKMICQSLGSTDNAQGNDGDDTPLVGEAKSDFLWFDDGFDDEE